MDLVKVEEINTKISQVEKVGEEERKKLGIEKNLEEWFKQLTYEEKLEAFNSWNYLRQDLEELENGL